MFMSAIENLAQIIRPSMIVMIVSYLYLYLKYEDFEDNDFQNMIMITDVVNGVFWYVEYQVVPNDPRRKHPYGIMVPQPTVVPILFYTFLALAKFLGWTNCFYGTPWVQDNFIKLGLLSWSIDVSFFHDPRRPLYLTGLALAFLCFCSKSTDFYITISSDYKFMRGYFDLVLDNPTTVLFTTYIIDIIHTSLTEMDIMPPLDYKPREDIFWIGEYNDTAQAHNNVQLNDHNSSDT